MFRFDAVVFDFDGVLVQSVDVKTHAFAALYREYGQGVVDKVVAWHLDHGGVSRYEKFRHFHRAFLDREISNAEEQRLGERFSALVEQAVIAAAWVPGAREFLDSYCSRLPLLVASGTPEDELVRIVSVRGMTQYFAGIAGAPRKKDEILTGFARRLSCSPERMLMVGDSMTDYLGAAGAGTAFVGVAGLPVNPFPTSVTVMTDLTRLADLIISPQPFVSESAR